VQELITDYVPLLVFGLVPVWIPIIGVTAGAVVDRLRPRAVTPAELAVRNAKHRSARLHAEMGITAIARPHPSSFSASSALAR
jgi:hypothetical protein